VAIGWAKTFSALAVTALAGVALELRRRRAQTGQAGAGPRPAAASFEQVAQQWPQLQFVADDATVVHHANPSWSAYTGQDTARRPDLLAAVHPDDREALLQAWHRSRKDHAAVSLPVRLRDAQGGHRHFQLQAAALQAGDGTWRWYGTFIDIEALSHAQELLAAADRRNDVFLATLAHELRNPLAPIRNAAQVLMSTGVDATQHTWAVQIIDRQVANLGLLLDDLLEASRITRGAMTLNKESVVLRSVVDAAVELARPAIDRQRHDFSVSSDALSQTLAADPLRLTQVLGILLDNAARYTAPGGRIGLDASCRGDQVELRVTDSGIGLAAQELEQVFDIFTQVRVATPGSASAGHSQTEGGLGIGLALVKGLVRLHGGSVAVNSAGLGQGCVFRVLMPLGKAPPPTPQPQPPEGPCAHGHAVAGPLRVLVVDDNHDGADTLAALLQHAGHRVDVAYDGQEALRLAQNLHPDVAVIDLGMPRVDGCDVARRLRREPWSAGLYLIAATGWGQAEDKQRTRASGFDRHLVKPIDPLHVVQMLADRGRQRPAGPY